MCDLYSVTKGQAAIIELTRAFRDTTGTCRRSASDKKPQKLVSR